jgi:hypothetical protein
LREAPPLAEGRRAGAKSPKRQLLISLSRAKICPFHLIIIIRLQIEFQLSCDICPFRFAILETEKGAPLRAPFYLNKIDFPCAQLTPQCPKIDTLVLNSNKLKDLAPTT